MKKQDIQIAITAILNWQYKVKIEQGKKENQLFFIDTSRAISELKKLMNILEK